MVFREVNSCYLVILNLTDEAYQGRNSCLSDEKYLLAFSLLAPYCLNAVLWDIS